MMTTESTPRLSRHQMGGLILVFAGWPLRTSGTPDRRNQKQSLTSFATWSKHSSLLMERIPCHWRHVRCCCMPKCKMQDELMKSSTVSAALPYPELCVAAKSEEQRQTELRRRQQYCRAEQTKSDAHPSPSTFPATPANGNKGGQRKRLTPKLLEGPENATRGSTDHLYKDCRQRGSESTGRPTQQKSGGTGTKTVTTQCRTSEREENPLELL